MRNTLYLLVGLFSLFFIAWTIFSTKDIDNLQVHHSQKSTNNQKTAILLGNGNNVLEQNIKSTEQPLDVEKGVLGNVDGASECPESCKRKLSMLDKAMLDDGLRLDDRNFELLETYADDISVYLQNDNTMRQHYIQMALTTMDGDKRAFLTDVFKHLPYQQKLEVGEKFIGSENWRVRADGVTLIADNDVANLDISKSLMDIFSTEENSYVKGSILSLLKNNSNLKGHAETLLQLDSIIYNGIDSRDRIAAFKAKMQLGEQPYDILPDAVHALRTNEPEFQMAGLIAISQIMENELEYTENGVYIDTNSIRNDIENIRNMAAYKDDEEHIKQLTEEADAIYLRYFGY